MIANCPACRRPVTCPDSGQQRVRCACSHEFLFRHGRVVLEAGRYYVCKLCGGPIAVRRDEVLNCKNPPCVPRYVEFYDLWHSLEVRSYVYHELPCNAGEISLREKQRLDHDLPWPDEPYFKLMFPIELDGNLINGSRTYGPNDV